MRHAIPECGDYTFEMNFDYKNAPSKLFIDTPGNWQEDKINYQSQFTGDAPDRELNSPEEQLPEADDPMIEINNDEEKLLTTE